jgi:hypothetical protein
MREWHSTEPNPDEEHLRALWQAEINNLKASLAEEEEFAQRRRAKIWPLIEASGLSEEDIAGWVEEAAELSRKSLEAAKPQLMEPPFDIEALHEQDVQLARANEKLMESP